MLNSIHPVNQCDLKSEEGIIYYDGMDWIEWICPEMGKAQEKWDGRGGRKGRHDRLGVMKLLIDDPSRESFSAYI